MTDPKNHPEETSARDGATNDAAEQATGLSPTPNTIRRANARQGAFLTAFATTGNVSAAARAAGIDRSTHYDWLKNGQTYCEALDEARDDAADALEAEARRRAYEGIEEPVFQGGRQVGTIRRYSDTLLIFLLRGARPEKYGPIRTGNRVQVNVVQQTQQPNNQDSRHMDISPNRRAEYDRWMRIVRGDEVVPALPSEPAGGHGDKGGNANGQH